MRKRKFPDVRLAWARNWDTRPDPRPGWGRDDGPFPLPGTPAPANTGEIDFVALHERTARREWENAHVTWLTENGLACSQADLDSWWTDPDHDQVPMPGVLQWQQRIAGYYGSSPGQPLDATAAKQIRALQQQVQELQQARQGDAARITWAEAQYARVSGDLADTAARHDEQAAAIAGQKKEAAQLKETNRQLEGTVHSLNIDIARKNAAIRKLETDTLRAASAAAATERALATHQELVAWQEALITQLQGEKQELADLVTRLQARTDRLARALEGHPGQLPAATGAGHG